MIKTINLTCQIELDPVDGYVVILSAICCVVIPIMGVGRDEIIAVLVVCNRASNF